MTVTVSLVNITELKGKLIACVTTATKVIAAFIVIVYNVSGIFLEIVCIGLYSLV